MGALKGRTKGRTIRAHQKKGPTIRKAYLTNIFSHFPQRSLFNLCLDNPCRGDRVSLIQSSFDNGGRDEFGSIDNLLGLVVIEGIVCVVGKKSCEWGGCRVT